MTGALVLVVAKWCAPCRAELAHRAVLAAAAAPHLVRAVAIDDAVFARSAGLPCAFATDAAGRRCADHAGGITPALARALVARCPP